MNKIGNRYSSSVAREYIKENIGKKNIDEIVTYLRETTTLKVPSIERLYRDIKSERDREIREEIRAKTMEERSKVKYKGRKREFFYIDDSKLYKGLIKE
ncbi:hypothetical protein [Clostridium tertium]|uniref:hypothetical protein n=1 Tax=Clostridium tertium TaxID=1559 RepID=UPI001C1DDF3F|nr:hypothetical protein [Clostridium tertium]MBU6137305.1 hypothetical protein [Clostridium tertium]